MTHRPPQILVLDGDQTPPAASPRLTCAYAYARHRRRIAAMLAWMSEELESHAQRTATAKDVQKSANELAEAETLLRRALMCLCGMSERKIKAALAAMRED